MADIQEPDNQQPDNTEKTRELPAGFIAAQWKKGDPSPNPGGRPKKTPITDLFRELFDGEYDQRRDEIRAVLSGKSAMAKVLLLRDAAERLEGKIAQNVHVDGEIAISLSERMAKARERVSE